MPNYRRQIDWSWIANNYPGEPGEDAWDPWVFILPTAGRDLLLSIANELLWRASYLGGHELDEETWDIVTGIVSLTDDGLRGGIPLEQILAEFDETQAILRAIRDSQCCNEFEPTSNPSGDTDVYPVEGPVNQPPEGGDFSVDDYPVTPATDPDDDGIVTDTDWESYVCGAADLLVDAYVDWLRFTDFAVGLGYGAIRIIDWFATRIAAAVLPGVLDDFAVWSFPSYTSIITDIYDDLTSVALQQAITDLEAVREDLKCAVITKNTSAAAVSAAVAVLNGAIQDATVLALLTTGPMAAIASLIWNAGFDAEWSTACECDFVGFSLVPVTVTGSTAIGATVTDVGNGWNVTNDTTDGNDHGVNLDCDAAPANTIGAVVTVTINSMPSGVPHKIVGRLASPIGDPVSAVGTGYVATVGDAQKADIDAQLNAWRTAGDLAQGSANTGAGTQFFGFDRNGVSGLFDVTYTDFSWIVEDV